MAKNTKKISSIIKSSVLSELNTESYSITQIAESHGISRSVIYKWIQELQAAKTQQVSDVHLLPRNNFIEIALVNNKNHQSCSLQKASLIFNDFSLCIEGNIGAARLLKILKNLEKIC